MPEHPLRIATRTSPLALWQARHVAAALSQLASNESASTELVPVTTEGDRRPQQPIEQMAGRGVFVAEVQAAVLDGRADVATHSAKDMRSTPTDGLVLVGCLARADARDALVGAALADLPEGATVATGSRRRQSQLAHQRPDLSFTSLRGNIGTRIKAVERSDVDAVVVAKAALDRLDQASLAAEVLSAEMMLPQAGQGAIAVECREDDERTQAALAQIVDPISSLCVSAERAVLAGFGGGCDLPAAAFATLEIDPEASTPTNPLGGVLALRALLADVSGDPLLTASSAAPLHTPIPMPVGSPGFSQATAVAAARSNAATAAALGSELAQTLLSDHGGSDLLGKYDTSRQ